MSVFYVSALVTMDTREDVSLYFLDDSLSKLYIATFQVNDSLQIFRWESTNGIVSACTPPPPPRPSRCILFAPLTPSERALLSGEEQEMIPRMIQLKDVCNERLKLQAISCQKQCYFARSVCVLRYQWKESESGKDTSVVRRSRFPIVKRRCQCLKWLLQLTYLVAGKWVKERWENCNITSRVIISEEFFVILHPFRQIISTVF